MIIIDAINAFPFLVLVIAIVAIVGPGAQGLLIGLAAVNWARYAKIARARALTLREAEFVLATQVLGYSWMRVLLRHLLPNVYSETLAYGLSDFVVVIITISGLSFLGAGVRPPTAEWGAMMADGRLYLQTQWWMTVFPGLALTATAIGVALLAQGLVGRFAGEE
jgi:peptide/nickel transport system permease protein